MTAIRNVRRYGIDAWYVPALFLAGGVAMAVLGLVSLSQNHTAAFVIEAAAAAWFLALTAQYMYTTTLGKFAVWRAIATTISHQLPATGELLDIGCGRGAAIFEVLRALGPDWHGTGVDIWSSHDQTGNGQQQAEDNSALLGLSPRTQFQTANAVQLPFADDSFDLVISSYALHNLNKYSEQEVAVAEILRVLRPGGHVAVVDLNPLRPNPYLRHLGTRTSSTVVSAGPVGWWSGPWYPTWQVVSTINPGATQ